MPNVLVTGANGFVGSAVFQHLRNQGWNVRGAVRDNPAHASVKVGDIDGNTNWQLALSDCETVIHLAARTHVMSENAASPLTLYRVVNTDATLNLAAQSAALGVRRFVFISTIKVNGEHGSFSPDDIPAPQDAYAVSKFEAEQGLFRLGQETGMEIVIIRPPLIYGPGVKGNFAAMIGWIRKGVPLPFGAVHNQRSLVALDNLVDFIALCADREKSPQAANEVFLISDGEDVSTAELLRKVARAYDRQVRLLSMPMSWLSWGARLLGKEAVADRLLGSLLVDSGKAHVLLNWHPVVSIDEQLKKMARNVESI